MFSIVSMCTKKKRKRKCRSQKQGESVANFQSCEQLQSTAIWESRTVHAMIVIGLLC